MLFRKKPVVVEAEEYRKGGVVPKGVIVQQHKGEPWAFIETEAGRLAVEDGDFIVTGLGGERYPVKAVRFWEIYEVA